MAARRRRGQNDSAAERYPAPNGRYLYPAVGAGSAGMLPPRRRSRPGPPRRADGPAQGRSRAGLPGCGCASSLPLRGSTTVSAPPCRTSVRAPMRAFLSPPAYRAPAAAWAGRTSASAGREPCSSRRRFTSSGWSPDGPRRQGVFRVAAPRRLGRHAGGRHDQPHGGGGHGVGEGPARSRARQDETVNAFRVGDRQFLGHHAAQARPQHVGPADAGGIEHGHDVAGHVGYGERAGRPVAVPDAAVVHQHQPEVAPQFPQHRFPAETVQAHSLDQDQPRPPPVHGPAQLVGDPQRAVAGVPGPVHLADSSPAGVYSKHMLTISITTGRADP